MVDQTIHRSERHGRIGEDAVPLAEGLIGGDQHRAAFVAGTDQFEQDRCLGLITADVGEVVEDQQMVLVELCQRGFERQFAPGNLEPLHQIGSAGEQDAPTIFDQRQADGGCQMGLAATGRAEQDEVGPLLEPSIARAHGHEGGIEQAFYVSEENKPETLLSTAKALYFAICCTAPIHNIKNVIVTGELFEDYGDEILPLTQGMLNDSPDRHIREIHIRHYKTGYYYGVKGLVQLSSDGITELLV